MAERAHKKSGLDRFADALFWLVLIPMGFVAFFLLMVMCVVSVRMALEVL